MDMSVISSVIKAIKNEPVTATMTINIQNEIVANASGEPMPLNDYAGKVMLIVNVASKCGFTPQYAGLEALNKKYAAQGLQILGFPCNQFGGQEPGTQAEIAEFCSMNYGVTFPVLEKVDVKGDYQSSLFKKLVAATGGGDVKWNFEKHLVARDGTVIKRFSSRTAPDSPELVGAIEQELAKVAEAGESGGWG